ncbi:peptidyl-prolyl cis-trans isomerase [Acinetobacter baumannii ABNIH10]|nr:peptidyl-prolyl cis-trans isomerase [Acinetobacter baumannii ABNIH10]
MHSFAQPTDEVVAIVDNSVILKSDLEQGMAEAAHELQATKKRSSTSTILTISSIRPTHLTSSTT